MLTTTVITRSTAARAITELVPRPGCASANWLTIADPRVAPGSVSEWGSAGRLPMTMATAIASPMARPTASVTAAPIPGRAVGSTTLRTTCQRVAPSAIAASRSSTGTPRRAVRERATSGGQCHNGEDDRRQQDAGPVSRSAKSHAKDR